MSVLRKSPNLKVLYEGKELPLPDNVKWDGPRLVIKNPKPNTHYMLLHKGGKLITKELPYAHH